MIELVDGVTKLDKVRFRSRQEAVAESFRKMLLAMARDLRVILIKLADRLHNMRTLGSMDAESRRRIARETLEIYAPIAQRLGMNRFKAELQDLGFRALHPDRHRVIAERIRAALGNRREAMARIEVAVEARLNDEAIAHRVVSRIKSPYSIYSKMRNEQKSFAQVMDVYGFRVVVDSARECYHTLGAVHGLYKPLDGRFRDFIAIPKANGYQSLHTVLFGPFGAPIEIQIRTEDMDAVADRGVAAHWAYKTDATPANSAQSRAREWVSGLVDRETQTPSSLEFIENVKVDLFPDDVYLFTPKGQILALPRNATALDFAYAVHTDVGNHAVAARVDKKLVPLRTPLVSGQTVEIVTAPSALPSPQWLEWVVSGRARTAIRHHLKHLQHEDAVEFGHRMLDRALDALDGSLEGIPPEVLDRYLAEQKYKRLEELLADIALGNRVADVVAQVAAVRAGRASACGASAQQREDPDQWRRAWRAQFRQLLPSAARRRDHGASVGRQGHRRAPRRVPERTGAAQIARALHRNRLGRGRPGRLPRRAAHRGHQQTRRARAGRRGDRGNRIRTSRTSSTRNATARLRRCCSRSRSRAASTSPT